ncbi:19820_t:CDS:10 [Cetraspora pellucida]|uniref:19820_t:CDS:1 n=1 Tax=Cetraspora pellucida TaxID=1433469 RepID=A0A9N9APN2_9GLOM|nr:19820_t:CDS:10 [Cetraspora pellucida]
MAQTYSQQQPMQQSQIPEYTLPGVLHFLQSEWRRYERDRNEWEIERAEMKARIALLEGERRGIETMKINLMRRVKMLEFALRQERSKYLAGISPTQPIIKESSTVSATANEEGPQNNPQSTTETTGFSQTSEQSSQQKSLLSSRDPNYRIKSREILKACLQEIDYLTNAATSNPSISNRLLSHPTGLNGNNVTNQMPNHRDSAIWVGGNSPANNSVPPKRLGNVAIKPSRPAPTTPPTILPILPTNSSSPPLDHSFPPREGLELVSPDNDDGSFFPKSADKSYKSDESFSDNEQSSFGFPRNDIISPGEMTPVGNGIDGLGTKTNDESYFGKDVGTPAFNKPKFDKSKFDGSWKIPSQVVPRNITSAFPSKSADELREEEYQLAKDVQKKFNLSDEKISKLMKNSSKKNQSILPINTSDPQLDELSLSVEEVENTEKSEVDKLQENSSDRKMWRQRFTLKSHLDTVRSISWHKSELVFASGSEDGTVKLWNLKGPVSLKPTDVPDIEPTITYRGHTAAVNSVVIASEQHRCYSASMDSTIRVWNLPPPKRDNYGPVDSPLNFTTYIGHTDAIWDLRLFPICNLNTQFLASASADGSVKIWNTEAEGSPLKSSWGYYGNNGELPVNGVRPPIPTSIDFVHSDLKKIAVSFQNSIIKLYDIETGQSVVTFNSDETYDKTPATQINRVFVHPTMPLLFSAHEDKYIRFFDVNSGKCNFSMLAHLDSVTTLDIDPSGMILISGGHDSSIRLWDIVSTRQCIQEFVSHRKKSDEGVLCVEYHRSLPWMASGGADSVFELYLRGDCKTELILEGLTIFDALVGVIAFTFFLFAVSHYLLGTI